MKKLLFIALIGLSLNACKKEQTNDTNVSKKLTVVVSHLQTGTSYSFKVTNQSNITLLNIANKTADTTYTGTSMVNKGDVLTCYYIFNTPGTTIGIGWITFEIDGLPRLASANGSLTNNFTVN